MATCPECQEKIRPFGVAPAPKGLGVNHVVCPYCGTPLMIPAWIFFVPFLLASPVAAVAHAYIGEAGVVLAMLLIPGPLILLLFRVEPYGETMLDLRAEETERRSERDD